MNRIRIALIITFLVGVIYSAAGLFESLFDFGIGLVVASAAVIGYGLCDFVEAERDEHLARVRAAVWERRDRES